MNYTIWDYEVNDRLCSLKAPENIKNAFELCYGISRESDFPSDASFRMNPEFKKATKLTDNVFNNDFLLVASRKLADFFKSENVPSIEYLPVKIFDQKNKLANEEFFIIHQVGTQDCIDLKNSQIDWNLINPDQISAVDALVIDETKIDKEATLFRAKHLPNKIFIKRDLARKIEDLGITGIRFEEIEDYTEV